MKHMFRFMFFFFTRYARPVHRVLTGFFCLIIWQGCFKFRTSDPKAIEEFKKSQINGFISDFAYGNRLKLHYAESGDSVAPTLLFIHGTPGSWNNFQLFLTDSSLANKYRMISIDRPGFGYSNFGKAIPIQEQVELFNSFLRSKDNGKPVVLIGHSLGGPIIAGMAVADSTLADCLVFLSGSFSPELEPREAWRKPLALPIIRGLAPGAFRPSNDEMLDFKKYVLRMPHLLAAVKCTTYVVHGTKDMFVPYANLHYADKHLTGDAATLLITLEGENHFIPWTKFENLRELLLYIYNNLK